MSVSALHAFRRFGFGRRGTQPAADNVTDWLKSQLDVADPVLARPGPSMLNMEVIDRRYVAAKNADLPRPPGLGDLFGDEMTTSLQTAITTDIPLRERLVWFWANHFTVASRGSPLSLGLNGTYVYEAIRPHVTGRFADLVKAVMRHPAMLDYLNNNISVGPDSPFGRAHHLGINENLARESLELHTLGITAGYTQRDVTSYAELLTGRSFNRNGDNPGFVYYPDRNQPGPETILGHAFPDGLTGSEQAIEWIANHPATHRHIAGQLVQHFVSDNPPTHCVDRVAGVMAKTGGDLKQAICAIIDLDEAWQPLTKFRAPDEYVIAVQRALDLPFEPGHQLLVATADLGQPFRNPLLPNGWPDTAADWISGEGLLKRADWAMTQASRHGAPSAEAVIEATIGDICSAATWRAVRACPTPAEALATVFASPEFNRR